MSVRHAQANKCQHTPTGDVRVAELRKVQINMHFGLNDKFCDKK